MMASTYDPCNFMAGLIWKMMENDSKHAGFGKIRYVFGKMMRKVFLGANMILIPGKENGVKYVKYVKCAWHFNALDIFAKGRIANERLS